MTPLVGASLPRTKTVLRPTTARPPADAGWVAAGRARPFRAERGGRGGWPRAGSREDVAGRRGRGGGGAKLPLTPQADTDRRGGSRGTGRRSRSAGSGRWSARAGLPLLPRGKRRGPVFRGSETGGGTGRGRLPRGTRRGGGGGAMRGRSGSGREIGSAEPRRYPAGAKGALSIEGHRRRDRIRTASSRRGELGRVSRPRGLSSEQPPADDRPPLEAGASLDPRTGRVIDPNLLPSVRSGGAMPWTARFVRHEPALFASKRMAVPWMSGG